MLLVLNTTHNNSSPDRFDIPSSLTQKQHPHQPVLLWRNTNISLYPQDPCIFFSVSDFLCGIWGFKSRSSHSHSNYFAHWDISQAPSPLFLTRNDGILMLSFLLLIWAIIEFFFCSRQWSILPLPLFFSPFTKTQPDTMDCLFFVWFGRLVVFEDGLAV